MSDKELWNVVGGKSEAKSVAEKLISGPKCDWVQTS